MMCSVCGLFSRPGVLYGDHADRILFACETCISHPFIFLNFKRYELPKLPPLQMELWGAMLGKRARTHQEAPPQ